MSEHEEQQLQRELREQLERDIEARRGSGPKGSGSFFGGVGRFECHQNPDPRGDPKSRSTNSEL